MKPPFYRLTCRCDYCPVETFVTERKNVESKGTDEKIRTTTRQVCPNCRTLGYVEKIEKVTEIII